jgi:hypothetical protein
MGFPAGTLVEGDDVIVAGKQRGRVLMGTAYRNFSRSRAEATTGVGPMIVAALLLVGIAGFLYWGWSSQGASGPDLADGCGGLSAWCSRSHSSTRPQSRFTNGSCAAKLIGE